MIFTGYRSADYPDVLRACDVFTMLVPGSDGGCRALLESAACGLPAVTTNLGSLPEIVEDGETGLVVAPDPAQLAAAWRSLLESAPLRAAAGRGRAPARRALLSPARLAEEVERLYQAAFKSAEEIDAVGLDRALAAARRGLQPRSARGRGRPRGAARRASRSG